MGDPKGQPPEREIVKPDFHGNVGKTGEVFNHKNPFFEMAAAAGSKKLKEALERSKLKAPYTKAYKAENGAVVEVSPFAHLDDYKDNFKTAKVLADNRISVKIRPHINILKKYKNPEYEVEGINGDRVEPKTKNLKRGISSAFDEKFKKGKQLREEKQTFIVIDVSRYELTNEAVQDLASQSWSKFNHYKTFLNFIIFQHKERAVKIDVKTLDKGYMNYKNKILTIKKKSKE